MNTWVHVSLIPRLHSCTRNSNIVTFDPANFRLSRNYYDACGGEPGDEARCTYTMFNCVSYVDRPCPKYMYMYVDWLCE